MNVLVVGSGAREHALVRSLAHDPAVTAVIAAPGNPGIAKMGDPVQVLPGVSDVLDGAAIVAACRQHDIDLVVVGPEAPLVAGLADAIRQAGFACVGPSAAAARLEGSKAFAKEVMAAADVPTARARVCSTAAELREAMDIAVAPFVVKDDGLASGKGVVVTDDADEALAHGLRCLDGLDAQVVVEDFLDGPEVSLFCLSDGHTVLPWEPAQDFKRLSEGDTGPNTGGMGAYSPLPWVGAHSVDLIGEVMERVARPTVAEMARRGTPFVGVLYIGLALTSAGPRVVEFNARFGDPEVQTLLARLLTPLGALLHAAATGTLADVPPIKWSDEAAVTVVLAASGYPQAPVTGASIRGVARAEQVSGVHVLHAGTALRDDGELISAGGRVLSVVATGKHCAQARNRAYTAVTRITMEGSQHRPDIAAAVSEPVYRSMDITGHVPLYAGKVRELYAPLDPQTHLPQEERMLWVASDRVSVDDHVVSPPVPDKGIVLTQLSLWWLEQLSDLCSHHLQSTTVPAEVQGRAVYVHRLEIVPVTCVARAYLSGDSVAEYHASGAVSGVQLPPGLVDSSELPEPIFTPYTKTVDGGHDTPITFEQVVEMIGPALAAEVRDLTVAILSRGADIARERGIIIAETTVEFGILPAECPAHALRADGSIDWTVFEAHQVRLIVAGEILTPDSSRLWRADEHPPGPAQTSYDKQVLHDWLASADSGWSNASGDSPPPLPADIVAQTRARYLEIYRTLTGEALDSVGA